MRDRLAPSGEGRLKAIVYVLFAALVFAVSDTIAKIAVARLPPAEVYFFRSLVVVAVSLPLIVARKGWRVMRTQHPWLQLVRGACVVGASLMFLTGLIHLPLADATAINFVWPLLVTVFAMVILKERIGFRRVLATAVGFIGMLVIVRPGSGAFDAAAIYPLGAAVVWAFAAVLTRLMSADESAETTILWSAMISLAASTAILPFVFVWPTPAEMAACVLIGLGSATAHSMIVVAYTQAPASALAPFSYTQLVWAAVCGYLLFSTLPDVYVVAGSALIAASGIYTAHRERVRSQAAKG